MRTYNFLTEFPTLHPMDSYHCMSIHPLIPMIELFLNLTFKIQGQSHSSRSHNRNNILSTLVPCQLALPFPRYSIFKIWPWKSKVKVIAQGHKIGITPFRLTSLLFHVHRPCHSWDTAISKFDVENSRSRSWVRSKWSNMGPTFSRLTSLLFHVNRPSHSWVMTFFKIWPWNSKVKVMGEVTVQTHNVGLTSYRLTSLSFHVNLASHYWVKDFFKIWPWNSRVKVMGEVTVQSHNVGLTSYRLTSLSFHVNRPSHSWHTVFSKFDLENQGSRSWVR